MKLCIDCRWYRERQTRSGIERNCADPMFGTDPVTGDAVEKSASIQRAWGFGCGSTGSRFSPRVFNQVKGGATEMVNL